MSNPGDEKILGVSSCIFGIQSMDADDGKGMFWRFSKVEIFKKLHHDGSEFLIGDVQLLCWFWPRIRVRQLELGTVDWRPSPSPIGGWLSLKTSIGTDADHRIGVNVFGCFHERGTAIF